MLSIAVIVPPISNFNTPYSAVPRLAGWLRKLGHRVHSIDLSLELILRIFSRAGLQRIFAAVDPRLVIGEIEDVWNQRERYVRIIDPAIAFLQGRDPGLAFRIVRGDYIPEGPCFRAEEPLADGRYGEWGRVDHARQLISFALQDLATLFEQTITPHFKLLRYAESLTQSSMTFDGLAAELERPPNIIEEMTAEAAADTIPADVDLVCFTCPFPGMLLGSLFVGKWLATHRPHARRAVGGGYPSTELRSITDPRIFDYIDTLSLDDGEIPLQQICARLEGQPDAPLFKTFTRENGAVTWHAGEECAAPRFRELPAPDYAGLDMRRYIHLILFGSNPVARLSNEGAWMKLTAAHGCYWKKCTFCDIHLPYIADFDPLSAIELADQMDAMHGQTGLSSYHFTDEAAPPPLLVNLALELLRRGRDYQFWGNIRYDTGFTKDRCKLLAAAGMIAVTGGIEIASDDLLPKIAKGITVTQVIRVLEAFSRAKILTHAYLIYGFPGEREQDTVNSLEVLRQLVRAKLLQSGFYHKFMVTRESPVGRNPELFGIRTSKPPGEGFANYNRFHEQLPGTPATDDRILKAIKAAFHNFVNGIGLDTDVRSWFPREVPAPTIPATFVEDVMNEAHDMEKAPTRVCWLGGVPRWSRGVLSVTCADGGMYTVPASQTLADNLWRCHPASWRKSSPPGRQEFEDVAWASPLWARGLVTV